MSERTADDAIDRYTAIAASIAAAPPSGADELRVGELSTVINRLHPRRLSLEVTEVITETPTTVTLRMASTGPALPPFLAGQYINLFVELDGTRTSRPFAISSAPAEPDHYDLTVRETPGGFVSPYLVRHVRPGDRLDSTGPMGEFFHNPLFHGDRLMFIAGGSGIAPARSMIRDIVTHGRASRLHLVYGSKHPDDIIFRDELDELARAHDTIDVTHVISEPDPGWSGRTGFITTDLIAELAGPHLHTTTYYLCGPPPMDDLCRAVLGELGVARRRVRYEANGPPAHPERLPGWPGQLDPATTVAVSVSGHDKFVAPCGEPLLNSLERAGYEVEVGCRSGQCSLCRVKILSGTVVNGPEARIRRSDVWTGHTHACTAFPVSDIEVQLDH
jgi:ferredoxin-NADP reductase